MPAYYNEIDPYAAAWLRNLIQAGLIAPGEVDTRSIVDVRPGELVAFEQCHFFAGLGGWGGALRLAGFPDDRPVWTGSCPCQPFSLAGKQKGFADDRHLWPVWRELIAERRPAKVYGEQVASASSWLGLVRGDLEALDYAVGAVPIEAASAGADHLRDRYWFVGNAIGEGELQPEGLERKERGWFGDTGYLGNASGSRLSVGSIPEVERGDVRQERPAASAPGDRGVALADSDSRAIRYEPGRSRRSRGADPGQYCDDSEVSLAHGAINGQHIQQGISGIEKGSGFGWDQSADSNSFEWVYGADGKARRVKPGIRLLAHGVPARVAKLRALGNAIDLRPAAAFIKATM